MVVTTLTRLKQQVGWPYQRLTESLGLPYASFRRWKHRLAYGQPGFSKPGPKRVTPLNLDELRGHLCRLEQLFWQHGPPLVLKRDNGSNLNHQTVDEVLARYLVIPLNSPPHYPPYNGGWNAQCGK